MAHKNAVIKPIVNFWLCASDKCFYLNNYLIDPSWKCLIYITYMNCFLCKTKRLNKFLSFELLVLLEDQSSPACLSSWVVQYSSVEAPPGSRYCEAIVWCTLVATCQNCSSLMSKTLVHGWHNTAVWKWKCTFIRCHLTKVQHL